MSARRRIELLEQRLREPLPGDEAKRAMLPLNRKLRAAPSDESELRDAAVLILLFPEGDDLGLPLMIRRHVDGDVHAGQISLPGGGREPDETLRATALRETQEELGIDPADLRVLGRLSPQWIPVSGYRVHPFVAAARERPRYSPDPVEVDRVIETTVDRLLDDSLRGVWHRRVAGKEAMIPGWRLEEGFLWGATAMILSELLAVVPPGPLRES